MSRYVTAQLYIQKCLSFVHIQYNGSPYFFCFVAVFGAAHAFLAHIHTHLAAELLDGLVVPGDVGPGLSLEDFHKVLHHALVEVFAAEVGVTVGRQHLRR